MAYGYSRKITIDHTKVGTTDSTNFTVLVSGTYSYLATLANGGKVTNASGFDVIFTSDAAGTSLLNWEIETYTASNGNINFWVRIPTLSSTVDTVFYMFYGNATVVTFQGGATGTAWDTNFAMIYHLPNGTVLSANDSTGNTVAGTISGPTAVAGQIDGAGVWGAVSTDKITSALTTNNTLRTYEAWLFITGSGGGGLGRVFEKRVAGVQVENMFNDSNITLTYDRVWSGGTASWGIAVPTSNVWHAVAVTYDAADAANKPKFYLDGALQALTVDANVTGSIVNNTDAYVVGNRGNDNARNWQGNIDEFKISNVLRSADWITASFNNQSVPSTFYAVSGETSISSVQSTGGLNNVSNISMLNMKRIIL